MRKLAKILWLKRFFQAIPSVALCLNAPSLTSQLSAEPPYNVIWGRQFGTENQDDGRDVTVDPNGNIYVAGTFDGDGYLSKYDLSGNVIWTHTVGTLDDYVANKSVAVDALGNTYVVGLTLGDLFGSSSGREDAYIIKYDPLGNSVWSKQFGTSTGDYVNDVAVDHLGNSYTATNSDNFTVGTLAKLDPSGGTTWTRHDAGTLGSVAVDSSGNVLAVGGTRGVGFVRKYDSAGNSLWSCTIDTPFYDSAADVAVDADGNAYVTGTTQGEIAAPSAGDYNAFVIKYDPVGNEVWSRQFGGPALELGESISQDGSGNIYISGIYEDFTEPYTGGEAFIVNYDTAGTLKWAKQIAVATSIEVGTVSVAASSMGDLYVTGTTFGSVVGEHKGHLDAYLLKLSAVPEPMSIIPLLAAALISLVLIRKHS